MFGRFEKLAREHQEIKQKEAPEDRKEIERKSKENYESVKRLALLILAEALLSNFQDSPMNELVGAELWLQLVKCSGTMYLSGTLIQ